MEDVVYLEVTAAAVRPALVVCSDQGASGGKLDFGEVGVGKQIYLIAVLALITAVHMIT